MQPPYCPSVSFDRSIELFFKFDRSISSVDQFLACLASFEDNSSEENIYPLLSNCFLFIILHDEV